MKKHSFRDHKDVVGQVMHRWKHHDPKPLHSGKGKGGKEGKIVKSKKQAIAIALSMAKKSSNHCENLVSLGYSEETSQKVYEILGEFYEYTRCQRPDGTYYGTLGQCKKGSEVGARRGEYAGGGLEGKLYDIGKGKVLKVGKYGEEATQAHSIAASLGLSPRLYASGISKKGKGFQVMDMVKLNDIEGLPHPGRSNKGKEIEEMSPDQLRKEKEAYKASLLLNSKGVSHEDLHGGNLKWDQARNKPVILDFDNARVNAKAAKDEASLTLNSIGIRLEQAGFYDEADKFYSISSKVGKSSPKAFAGLIEKAKDLVDEEFPS